jgi:hypothetical protein
MVISMRIQRSGKDPYFYADRARKPIFVGGFSRMTGTKIRA